MYAGTDGRPGELKEVTCYGVASVYTPHDRRKKGYASHMMRLLHWALSSRNTEYNLPQFPSEWGTPPAEVEHCGKGLFSVLYGDLGEEFYKRTGPGLAESGGWEASDHISTVWEVHPEPGVLQSSEGWTWLKYKDLDRLWVRDVELIKRTVASMPMTGSNALVSFLPDKGVGSYTVFRSMYGAEKLVPVDTWGVLKDDGNDDQPCYATWSVDTRPWPPTLMVTRSTTTEETFPSLLSKVLEVAKRGGIRKVEIWNLPGNLMRLSGQLGGRSFERSDHINLPAIKWYGKGDTADIKWVFNEKWVVAIMAVTFSQRCV